MTIQETQQKAIDNGWKYNDERPIWDNMYGTFFINDGDGGFINLGNSQFFMSPEFWKCLGKSLGWGTHNFDPESFRCVRCGTPKYSYEAYGGECQLNPWIIEWHQFIDHLAEGKSPEDYFKDL